MSDVVWDKHTRGGASALIYASKVLDERDDWVPRTIHGAVWLGTHWAPQAWTAKGRAFDKDRHPLDLIQKYPVHSEDVA